MYRYLNFVVEKRGTHGMDFIDIKLMGNEFMTMIYPFYY